MPGKKGCLLFFFNHKFYKDTILRSCFSNQHPKSHRILWISLWADREVSGGAALGALTVEKAKKKHYGGALWWIGEMFGSAKSKALLFPQCGPIKVCQPRSGALSLPPLGTNVRQSLEKKILADKSGRALDMGVVHL